jgi:hypothetical protein
MTAPIFNALKTTPVSRGFAFLGLGKSARSAASPAGARSAGIPVPAPTGTVRGSAPDQPGDPRPPLRPVPVNGIFNALKKSRSQGVLAGPLPIFNALKIAQPGRPDPASRSRVARTRGAWRTACPTRFEAIFNALKMATQPPPHPARPGAHRAAPRGSARLAAEKFIRSGLWPEPAPSGHGRRSGPAITRDSSFRPACRGIRTGGCDMPPHQ